MGMYDLFVAELQCPQCDTVSAADHSTRMQTKGQKAPDNRYLPVGAPYRIDPDELGAAGYLPLHPPRNNVVKLLQQWSCSSCGHRSNWAEVTIDHEVIRSIKAVAATPAIVDTMDFVDDDLLDELDDEGSAAEADLLKRLLAAKHS